ncbi:hypothetical protein Tco_1091856 [Tanacetum coccineum]|uniref:Reverse transcriptase domain-containing protein n=1 Tax=Tanacetum coccineum TaxID=301880 RepID=A0ABQ5IAB6_9ASTR
MSAATIERLVNQRVADALATQEANGNNGNGNGNINGNVNVNADGNANGNANAGGFVSILRACTYKDFLNCQPLNFRRIEGAIGLARWFEKVESVFHISNCSTNCQVKFATCMLQGSALTWWNSHKRTIGVKTND